MAEKVDSHSAQLVRLPPAAGLESLPQVYTLANAQDERAKTLLLLLEKGHATVAPLREPKLILHSHLPHVLDPLYYACTLLWVRVLMEYYSY